MELQITAREVIALHLAEVDESSSARFDLRFEIPEATVVRWWRIENEWLEMQEQMRQLRAQGRREYLQNLALAEPMPVPVPMSALSEI